MRRAVARGRMFPQSFSTDRRYGRLSLKAIGLFPLMWSNADDQGRLCGDPEEIKYACCPNIDHITKKDIPELLEELEDNQLIRCYNTPKSAAIQLLDWWEGNQKMQWAWPSDYPPPEGWQDHLRYKQGAKTVLTLNWPPISDESNSTQVSGNSGSGEYSGEDKDSTQVSGNSVSGEPPESSPLTTPNKNKTIKRNRRVRGRGNSPERSGEDKNSSQVSGNSVSGETSPSPSPSPGTLLSENDYFEKLMACFTIGWGHVSATDLDTVTPRRAGGKETAQLRDLAQEISSAGGCPLDWIDDAFKEGADQSKPHISYVRAILLDWLDIERVHTS